MSYLEKQMSRLIPIQHLVKHYRRLEVDTGDTPRVGDYRREPVPDLALRNDPNQNVDESEVLPADYWKVSDSGAVQEEQTQEVEF